MRKIVIALSSILFSTSIFVNQAIGQKISRTQRTITDLNTIHQALINNTMQYLDKYPPFMNWLDNGLKKAKVLAKKVSTKAGYYYALSYYTSGFHNGHIRTSIGRLPYKYAGLLLKYQDGKYLVKYRSPNYQNLPPLKAELISCNGVSVQSIIDNDIISYRFIPKLESSYNQAANYLFFDANPFRFYPKSCKFKINGDIKTYHINWHYLTMDQTDKIKKHFINNYSFCIKLFGKNGLWLSIPTLFPEGSQKQFMTMLVKLMPAFRSYDPIVIDVRGNSGGNSGWAERILAGLYGKCFLTQTIMKYDHSYEVYRVSKLNLARKKWISNLYPEESYVVKKLQAAYDKGKASIEFKPDYGKTVTDMLPKFYSHIYFLTDNACFSSCLDFADYIYWLPNTTHIGLPTNADSPYTENNNFDLPGGARFSYTMKVWRDRPRKNNQPYIPKYRYNGDISNTKAVMRWVEWLYNQHKL